MESLLCNIQSMMTMIVMTGSFPSASLHNSFMKSSLVEPCPSVPGHFAESSKSVTSYSPTKSMLRRSRAKQTRQHLWETAAMAANRGKGVVSGETDPSSLERSEEVQVRSTPAPPSDNPDRILSERHPLDPWLFLDRAELACISQTCFENFERVKTSTPLFSFMPSLRHDDESQVADSDLDHCMETNDVVQTDGEFSVHQMHEVIDMVVAELSQTPLWAKVPEEIQADVVTHLKASYEKSTCQSYTGGEVRQLMEHTGRKCGEVAMSWRECV